MRIINVLIFLIFIFDCKLLSQILSPELYKKEFEIGYTRGLYHRNYYSNNISQEIDWHNNLLYIRYGITNNITFSLSGYFYNIGKVNNPERDYRSCHFGVGISCKLYSFDYFKISSSLNHVEMMYFDKSIYRFNKNARSLSVSLFLNQDFEIFNQQIFCILGSTYRIDKINQYQGQYLYIDKAKKKLGGLIGFDFIILKYFKSFLHLEYIEYLEYRYGFAVII